MHVLHRHAVVVAAVAAAAVVVVVAVAWDGLVFVAHVLYHHAAVIASLQKQPIHLLKSETTHPLTGAMDVAQMHEKFELWSNHL